MKSLVYSFVIFVLTAYSSMAQVAICGFDAIGGTNTAGDEFSFVLLRDYAAGEVIYFTEDEYSTATGNFNSGEGHLVYTVPAGGLLENEVVKIFESGANTFSVQCAGGTAVHLAGSGTWSYSGSDELYAYSASSATAPWSSIIAIHCFYYGSVINPPVDQIPTGDYPNVIFIQVNLGSGGSMNADFMDAFRVNTTPTVLLDGANWTKSTSNINLSCTDFTTQMILPVELINFDASRHDENVMLNWSTASEINNAYFQIEHSIDGRHFEKIEEVTGAGNSAIINHYNFTHKDPANGVNYYRLKPVDFDGRFDYSDVVSVEFRTEHIEVTIHPNPFMETITVQFPLLQNNYSSGERIIEVIDAYGRLIQSNKFPISDEPIRLNLSARSAGVYYIRTDLGNGEFSTHRIVKQLP